MTNNITITPSATLNAEEVAYEARMREADECGSPRYEDPVDLYGGDDQYNEYTMGDQGDW